MQLCKKTIIWLFITTHLYLYGCASTSTRTVPESHRLQDRTSDYPVGIITPQYSPKAGIDFVIEGKGSGASAGAAGGVVTCADLMRGGDEGSVLVFLLCAPIGAAVGAISGAVSAPSADEVEATEDRIHRQLQPLAAQTKLAESVENYLSSMQQNITITIADEK